MKTFDVQTTQHDQFVNITDQVQQAVQTLGVTDGEIGRASCRERV